MSAPSKLLTQHLPLLAEQLNKITAESLPILDLACGGGRNGKYLIEHGYSTTFADRNEAALTDIKNQLVTSSSKLASFWAVDFEQENFDEVATKKYAGILVFRYLHRTLFSQIKQAVCSGGFVVYETFTEQQASFGRPKNPNFLLKENELKALFSDWNIQYYFEGEVTAESGETKQAIAQIIAIKP